MRIESLGKRALFLIPSVKAYNRKYSKTKARIAKKIHNFLMKAFAGYTCASGNIYGYFGRDYAEYDELREYRVAFLENDKKTKIPKLKRFLAKLCADIGEECIYLELGEDAMLVYPQERSHGWTKRKQRCSSAARAASVSSSRSKRSGGTSRRSSSARKSRPR